MFIATAKSTIGTTIVKRSIYTVPKLILPSSCTNTTSSTAPIIPNVYSSLGFQTVWTDYQKYLCDQLTLVTQGTSFENYLPYHLILKSAKTTFNTRIFNLASAVHNNHLFIENIIPNQISSVTNDKIQPSRVFIKKLQDQYQNPNLTWEDYKLEILNKVEENLKSGQGWVFVVEDFNKKLHILTCNNHGTPYFAPRNQSVDLNGGVNNHKDYELLNELKNELSRSENKVFKDWTLPLIVVNLFDVAYLPDYGVAGRSKYLSTILDNLNWGVVNKRIFQN
ncbi:related to 37S ribosomal protein S26, mitochondrial [Saccharomycodes ludwigii]|uniref:Related to 37S ribosomal protein S26, mitochondrial n=1 Tax=Saccharomycodes ludwigii TaxID=36035 RepID=A0A376B425_9ASCO|nr:hypothetical protein SCDLUD_000089 [Saccharomycodes ludwigii]KAH3902512.1 hypothetical protein SCDLUD_000089 [Saccharomycodes ludwigii]SSD59427.1 related to 37S ribosomal protein S26, mitochondrial [Saccharomycodes ludwigii]